MSIPANKFQSIDKIAECGFSRILSSGLADTAEQGLGCLTEMNKYIAAQNYNLILMPGCGVTPENAKRILEISRCKEFHASAKRKVIEKLYQSDTDSIYSVTDRDIVQQLISIAKSYHID